MRIHANPGALKESTWKDYGVRFLFGGIVAVIAGVVAKEFGPVVGGLFLAFPAIFPASATLIEKHEDQKERKAGSISDKRGAEASSVDAAGTALGAIGLMVFAVVTWLVAGRLSPVSTLALALTAWAAVCLIAWTIRQRM